MNGEYKATTIKVQQHTKDKVRELQEKLQVARRVAHFPAQSVYAEAIDLMHKKTFGVKKK